MITVYDVVKWLESEFDFGANKYTSPTLSSKEEKVICCQRSTSSGQEEHQGIFKVLPIDIYIHWTSDDEETEEKANEIYNSLFHLTDFYIQDTNVSFLNIQDNAPSAMGKDGAGIYNYLIQIDLIV